MQNLELARVLTGTLRGIEGIRVRVEVDLAADLPAFSLVGLPSAGIREGRERIAAALRHSRFRWPEGRVTVNLAPADLRKDGAAMDLAIATAILLASAQIQRPRGELLRSTLVLGELALDGSVCPVRGLAALLLDADRLGVRRMIVPRAQLPELVAMGGVALVGVGHLSEIGGALARLASTRSSPGALPAPPIRGGAVSIRGQLRARRAIELAAIGGHHISLVGPPGCGKTLLAHSLASLLPALAAGPWRERLRIASCVDSRETLSELRLPPFRAPHHSITPAGLIGGGQPPRPGEITLAHRGVLFLDEFPEFARGVIEQLRGLLAAGRVRHSRAGESFEFPAAFQLVMAANPCPCGVFGSQGRLCECTVSQLRRYRARMRGPMADRIELWVELDREEAEISLREDAEAWPGVEAAERVRRGRELLEQRPTRGAVLEAAEGLGSDLAAKLRVWADGLSLSLRSVESSLRVADSIAALDGRLKVEEADLAEAMTYRYRGDVDGARPSS